MARRWHERVYRAVLRLFPSEFRAEFGEEMSNAFRAQYADARERHAHSLVRLWIRTLGDFVRRAPTEHLDVLRRDLTYALRLLARRRGFAAITFVTLAAGVGLNTAVFSLVDAILLRPLALPDSARLVRLFDVGPPPLHEAGAVSAPNFVDWRQQSKTLDAIALIGATPVTLTGEGDPEQLLAMRVSEDFFRVLNVRPALGRGFTEGDYAPLNVRNAWPRVVILGHDLWERRFGGRADVVGRLIRLEGRPAEVVCVLPAHFALSEIPDWGAADCVMPAAPDPRSRKARFLYAIGRLAPDVSLSQARAEFDIIADQLSTKYPDADKDHGVRLTPLLAAQTAGVRKELWLLFGAAVCVMLIAAANVTNLSFSFHTNNMLVRTIGDPREALPIVRSIVRQLDSDRALTRITTLEEQIDTLLAPRRFLLRLIGLFSAMAFALATIGVYGVVAESVAQRVPEIGIRVALGASRAGIRNLFVAQGIRLALIGVVVGLAGAYALRRGMATLVFGVQTNDPLTYLVAAAGLVGATVAACAIPAMRAAALDPVDALRRG